MDWIANSAYVAVGALVLGALARRFGSSVIVLVVGAYLLRAVLAGIDVSGQGLPSTGTDTVFFDWLATQWIIQSPLQLFDHFATGSRLYAWLLSLLYSVFGENRFLAQLLNAFVAGLAILYVHRSLRLLSVRSWAFAITALFAFWPSYVLFSSILLRESFLMWAVASGVYHYLAWQHSQDPRTLLRSFAGLVFAAMLHTGMILLLMLFPLIVLFQTRQGRAFTSRSSSRRWAALLFAGLVFLLLAAGVGLQKLESVDDFSAGSIIEYQTGAARDRTAYLDGIAVSSYADLIVQAPLRMLYFIGAPFPWQASTAMDGIAMLDGLFYLSMVTIILLNVRRLYRDSRTRALLVLTLAVAFTFALATSNYGTAIRHRAKLVSIMLILVPPPVRFRQNQPGPRRQRYMQRRA